MSLSTLINKPCEIERRSLSADTDRYGNYLNTTTIVATVCELQQRIRKEPGEEGELSDTIWRAFFPAGTPIDTSDAVVVDDIVYEVVGDPWQARNPRTQTLSHVEATLRKTGDSTAS
jgi:hypothetical protein